MKRTVKFSGYQNEPTLALNIWLNRHPASKLINIHVLNQGGHLYSIIAVVDVPEGTKIYQAECEDGRQSENEKYENTEREDSNND